MGLSERLATSAAHGCRRIGEHRQCPCEGPRFQPCTALVGQQLRCLSAEYAKRHVRKGETLIRQ